MSTTTITDDGFEIVERVEDIPTFESEVDEAAYWSTHAPSEDMMDQAEPIPDDELPPPRKATYPVSLRLDNDVLHRLRVLAAKKHTRYQTLLKTFLIERLYEEEQREGVIQTIQSDPNGLIRTRVSESTAQLDPLAGPPALVEQLAEDESFLRLMLDRLPVSPAQDKLYKLLLSIDPLKRGAPRSEIGKTLDRTQKQLDGVLGALGKRVNGTQRQDMSSIVGIGVLFEFWAAQEEWWYRLRPTFRHVLEDFYQQKRSEQQSMPAPSVRMRL